MKSNLQDLKETARLAFYWTSFHPDERGDRTIEEVQKQLDSDLESIPEEEKERYISGFRTHLTAWLRSEANCASSAITGGSNFNVARAEKANRTARKKSDEFYEFREKALKAIAKKIENAKPEQQKRNEAWEKLKERLLDSAATIHGINMGIEPYSKPLFVSNMYQKVETFAMKGDIEICQNAIDLIREFNQNMSVVITEKHKFFKLAELAESKREKKADLQEKENTELAIKGGKVIYNYQADRIQLLFDEKPSYNTISALKKIAFKWSPSQGVWQRQMTNNCVYSLRAFLKENEMFFPKE